LALPVNGLDLRYGALFQNHNNLLKGDLGRKSRPNFKLFHPVKIMEDMGKTSENHFQLEPTTKHLAHFWPGGLGDYKSIKKKAQQHFIKPSSTTSGSLIRCT